MAIIGFGKFREILLPGTALVGPFYIGLTLLNVSRLIPDGILRARGLTDGLARLVFEKPLPRASSPSYGPTL